MQQSPEDPATGSLAPTQRRQRNREQAQQAILNAARAIMRESGAAALNLNELARRVGVKTPSLYEYFSGKMALYDALFLLGVRLFAEYLTARLAEAQDGWDRLRLAMESYMTFAQENPELFQLLFERPVPHFVPSAESMKESSALLERARQSLAQSISDGEMAPGIPLDQVLDLTNAMMHGLAAQHLANEPHLPVGQGRFGSLIPAAMALFRAAWQPPEHNDNTPG